MSFPFFLFAVLFVTWILSSSLPAAARPIARITGVDMIDGDNVTVRRFIGGDKTPPLGARSADPFLVFDFYNISSSLAAKEKQGVRSRGREQEMQLEGQEDDNVDPSSRDVYRFPAHPHAGFVEIRYLLDGEMKHLDSCGVSGTVRRGQLHVLRAMRGLAHEETLRVSQDNGRLRGFQMWLDVPTQLKKSSKPSYRVVISIPEKAHFRRSEGGDEWLVTTRCIARDNGGRIGGNEDDDDEDDDENECPVSALRDMSLPHFTMVDVSARRYALQKERPKTAATTIFSHRVVPTNKSSNVNDKRGHTEEKIMSTCLVFSIAGFFSVSITNEKQLRLVAPGELFVTVLGEDESLEVLADANGTRLRTVGDSLRFLVACAPPLRQPVFKWQGLVFSDREALDSAVGRLKNGTFSSDCE